MRPLKALTVCQPYAWAIIKGLKKIENRTWPTSHRGPLLIHAGSDRRYLSEELFPNGTPVPPEVALVMGAIIGVVEVVDCVPYSAAIRDPFAEGQWCWMLAGARAFARPIPCSGRLRLWVPGPDVLKEVRRVRDSRP